MTSRPDTALPGAQLARFAPVIFGGLLLTLAFTLARGARWPNDWAEAQWLIGYDFGFVKRGLPGAALDGVRMLLPSNLHVESLIKAIGAALLLASNLVFLWMGWASVMRSGYARETVVFALLLTSSTYVVMSGHLAGYYDQIHVVLSFCSMALIMKGRWWPAAILAGLGILVHETIMVVGLPSILFLAWLRYGQLAGDQASVLGFLRKHGQVVWVPLAVFGSLLVYQAMFLDPVVLGTKLSADIETYRFVEHGMHKNVPGAMTHSFLVYLDSQSHFFTARLRTPVYWFQVLPVLGMLLGMSWFALRGSLRANWNFALLALITLLPLLMHAIAWDITRIWNYPFLVVLMGYWAIYQCREAGAGVRPSPNWLVLVASIWVVVQFFHRILLMDRDLDRFSMPMRAAGYLPALLLVIWLWWPQGRAKVQD